MIKIITKGRIKKETCENCGCYFSFDEVEDVAIDSDVIKKYISCPQCHEKIYIKKWNIN